MSAPTWERYMAPSLQFLVDGEVRRSREIVEAAADLLGVTSEQRGIRIPSGDFQWINRGNWALSYLARTGATERPSRGHHRITDVGRRLLADHPAGFTEKDLPKVLVSPDGTGTAEVGPVEGDTSKLDPAEQIASGVARIHADVADQLLTRLLKQEPVFFEQAVLDVLMAMGYGGAEGVATRTQMSNDEGIDGIIDQDALGLSRIYVQAKRYGPDNAIGRKTIQEFVGALAGQQASQGVFITTSRFSTNAVKYAASVAARVILVDGDRLAKLMIRYGVGVQVKETIRIVEIDEDFFE